MDHQKNDKDTKKPEHETSPEEEKKVPEAPAEPHRYGNANDDDEAWRHAADDGKEPHLFGTNLVRKVDYKLARPDFRLVLPFLRLLTRSSSLDPQIR